jgi:peptidyl-prolyl cis-trans isomerase B (cyclophilin B)
MSRPPLRLILPLLACALALSACGGSGAKSSQGEAAPTPTPAASETSTGCQPADKPAPKSVKLRKPKPTTELAAGKTYVATVSTSCGDFQITLDSKRAPKTGGSFKYLADTGFFDATTFHRIVAGFVIQGGDPKGDGTGGPGYKVVETPPKDLQYTRGVVAMAKTQLEAAGTSGSQFFVVTGQDAQLPPEYALLGKVTAGMDVVDKIAAVDTDPSSEQPVDPIVIRSVKVGG